MSAKTVSINLNPTEASFIAHLDTFAHQQEPPVECRIAGGWVRDKLLSLPSHDLDVALSISSGYSFALSFVDYLKTKDVPTTSVGRVAANPEQSKHLETGTTRVMGLECDFVGLRCETYAESRIPTQVELGTPFDDASRRDLTVNSLFYNVHSKKVEDHTGRGLDDLANKIARTPLPPIQTFHDDPLRVLRCVRFASRFDLSIADDVKDAIRDDEVRAALRTKVSKERIGIEVTKMIGKTPLRALSLIDELDLHSVIFPCEVNPSRQDALATAHILHRVLGDASGDELLWFAAYVSPFRDHIIKRKKEEPAISVILGEGLKLSTGVKDSVTNLFAAAQLLKPDMTRRSAIGSTLQLKPVRPWTRSVIWATVMAILPIWKGQWNDDAQRVVDQYRSFIDLIHRLDLPAAIDRDHLIDGTGLQRLLNIRPSRLYSVILADINLWELDHPDAGAEECTAWLKSMWDGEGRAEWEAKGAPPAGEKRKR